MINALGVRVEKEKVQRLLSVVPESYAIGDCSDKTKNIVNAVLDAFSYSMEV